MRTKLMARRYGSQPFSLQVDGGTPPADKHPSNIWRPTERPENPDSSGRKTAEEDGFDD